MGCIALKPIYQKGGTPWGLQGRNCSCSSSALWKPPQCCLLVIAFSFKANSIASLNLQLEHSCVLQSHIRMLSIGDPPSPNSLPTHKAPCIVWRQLSQFGETGKWAPYKGSHSLLCRKLQNSGKIASPLQRLRMYVLFLYTMIFLIFKNYDSIYKISTEISECYQILIFFLFHVAFILACNFQYFNQKVWRRYENLGVLVNETSIFNVVLFFLPFTCSKPSRAVFQIHGLFSLICFSKTDTFINWRKVLPSFYAHETSYKTINSAYRKVCHD